MSTTTDTRNINELLALDTYQGMTDAEIELVLQYRIDQAVSSREMLAKMTALVEREERILEQDRASSQQVHKLLQSIVSREFPTIPVGEPITVSPRSIGA